MTISSYKLENGMEVLLEENHAAKVVSFNVLVKVGSKDETDEEAGLCHVIEHMLFKGTPSRPMGTIARDVEAAGGEINAYTSMDQTVYYINMAMNFAHKGLEILGDAIKNPLFDAVELEKEKEVILEEVRRGQDNPSSVLSENLFRTSFSKHTYGRPIIGYPKTVKSFTREQILEFHKKWYSPHNISVVAVGDFDSKAMLKEIKKHFEDFRGPEIVPNEALPETDQMAPRVFAKEMNIQSTYMSLGFHIPNITHEDVPALDALAHILGGADSSRLEQEIKEKKNLVHNIYSYSFTPKNPGLFVIGTILSDANILRAIEAIKVEIEKIKNEPVTSEELSRAKLIIRSNEIYEKETVGGEGSKLAYFLSTTGTHEFERRYYQALSDVRTADIREVAKKYLDMSRANAVLITPMGSKWLGSTEPIKKVLLKEPVASPKNKKAEEKKYYRTKLKNGTTLIVIENHHLPLISICGAAEGGSRFETKTNNGVSALFSRTLTKGTDRRSAINIAQDIEKMAGNIDGFAGRNIVGVKCEFLSEHLHDGFSLFADVLTRPSFLKTEVAKEKKLLMQAIRDQEDSLSTVAFAAFLKKLYPKHPYGMKVYGTAETVKTLTQKDLINYHRNIFRASNTVITVTGDVSIKEVETLANELLGDLPAGKTKKPKIPLEPKQKDIREEIVIKKNKQQAHIVLGFQGTFFKSKDRYAVTVLNNILAGQGGRLFLTLRDQMSLAYAVSSVNQEGVEPGHLAVYIGTEPGKINQAVAGILQELKLVTDKPVNAEELERSKQYLVGSYELDKQRNSTIAGLYTFNEIYDLPLAEIEDYPDHIMAVTREDVLKAAKKYISLDAYTLAIVKPS